MNVHFTKKGTLGSVAISNKVMGLKKPLNNKLFGEMKLYIQLNAKLKDQAFSFGLCGGCPTVFGF
jgi:hypothetical protein